MKFLKRTGYMFLILQLSLLIGCLLGGLLAFPLRLDANITDRQTDWLNGIATTLMIAVCLFIAAFRESYNKREFDLKPLIGSFILIAVIRIPIGLLAEYGGTIAGGTISLANAVFLDESHYFFSNNVIEAAARVGTMLGIDLLVYLPAFIGGSYLGCKYRIKENEEMIQEHEEHIK